MLGVPVGTNQTMLLNSDISTERWAHEFRLTSPNNDTFEWLAGLYYTQRGKLELPGRARTIPGPFDLVTQVFPSEYEEVAAFGNITYYFSPKFDASVGMRYSSNDVSVTFTGTGLVAGPNMPKTTVSDDVETYMFNARYRPSEDVSLYARIASGYRPVSPNLGLMRSCDRRDPFGAVRRVGHAVELRARREGRARRRHGAVRRRRLSHQVEGPAGVPQLHGRECRRQRRQRRDRERRRGDASRCSRRNSFYLVGALNYAKSELDEDDPAIGGLEGEQLPGIPEWTFSLKGNWSFPLGDTLEGFIGGGVAYQDERKTSFIGGIGSDGSGHRTERLRTTRPRIT